jgi:hypothetical protein
MSMSAHISTIRVCFGARSALRAARLAGRDMRVDHDQTEQHQEFRQYVQQAAASSPASTADQLARLAGLRDRGSSPPTSWSGEKAKVPAARTAGLPGPYGRLDQTAQGNRNPQPFAPGSDHPVQRRVSRPVVGPRRGPPGLLVCLVTGDTGRVSPRPPVHRGPIAWDRAGASCGTR